MSSHCRRFIFVFTYLFTHFQDPTSSPFAMLPSSIPYSAKVAYPKDHVRTC